MQDLGQNAIEVNHDREYRFGRSPFWLKLYSEQYAMFGSSSWRSVISYRPPRARRTSSELPLIDISPRHPLFTVRVGADSFPLMVTQLEDVKTIGRGLSMGGERKLMLKRIHTLRWNATLRPRTTKAAVDVKVNVKFVVSPPLPPNQAADLQVELFVPMHQTEPWCFPYAPEAHAGATCLWSPISGIAISAVMPDVNGATGVPYHALQSGGSIVRNAPAVIRRSRGAYTFFVRLDAARTRSHAMFMHMRYTRQVLPPVPPNLPDQPAHYSLRQRAEQALHLMTDKGSYDVVGIERVYVRQNQHVGTANSGGMRFHAGFPFFPLDGARAMLDWNKLIGDEVGARLALLIARGIATDFAVIGASAEHSVANKGAFWDRRTDSGDGARAVFTDFMGDEFHSIASTARIARGLFGVYEHTRDLISQNAAINACQWLLLKQNAIGYYDGDRVCAVTGAVMSSDDTLAGIEVVIPFLQAYACTRNEVYATAAARLVRFLTANLMQGLVSTPIYRSHYITSADTPASVASLIRALAFVHAASPTRRAREDLEMAGNWLRAWDFSVADAYSAINQDGTYDGLAEIARGALQLAVVERDPQWINLATRILAAMPEEAFTGWHALPLFVETMLSLIALIPKSTVDMFNYTAKVAWSDYGADSTTNQYISVHPDGDGDPTPVDFLPLVNRIDSIVLLPILAHGPVERIKVIQNSRMPNLRDLRTGELVCQPVELAPFPFDSPFRWGCFTMEP
jgi:hypothetical protein